MLPSWTAFLSLPCSQLWLYIYEWNVSRSDVYWFHALYLILLEFLSMVLNPFLPVRVGRTILGYRGCKWPRSKDILLISGPLWSVKWKITEFVWFLRFTFESHCNSNIALTTQMFIIRQMVFPFLQEDLSMYWIYRLTLFNFR